MTTSDNREQIEFWNGVPGERWVKEQEMMDASIEPVGVAAMEAARVTAGERVLDIGCGCGATTLELAARVTRSGHVTGVDVSVPMLARARERAASNTSNSAPIEFVEADAAIAALPEVDLAYSRFGVMFFADPILAFKNIRRAAKRIAFVCWRPASENEWVSIPAKAIAPFLPLPAPVVPRAPGPFAFADKKYLTEILQTSGFQNLSIEPRDMRLNWSRSPDLAAGVKFLTQIGPSSRALADLDRPAKTDAIIAMTEAIAPYQTETGMVFGVALWIVTAT